MKAWIHPVLKGSSCWWCNGVGHFTHMCGQVFLFLSFFTLIRVLPWLIMQAGWSGLTPALQRM